MKISEARGRLKIGDEIRTNGDCGRIRSRGFFTGKVISVNVDSFNVDSQSEGYRSWGIFFDNPGEIKLLNRKEVTIMNKLSIMMKKLLSSDIQTLVKAGYINGDLNLTTEGERALNAVLFEANKKALVELAEKELADAKEDTK